MAALRVPAADGRSDARRRLVSPVRERAGDCNEVRGRRSGEATACPALGNAREPSHIFAQTLILRWSTHAALEDAGVRLGYVPRGLFGRPTAETRAPEQHRIGSRQLLFDAADELAHSGANVLVEVKMDNRARGGGGSLDPRSAGQRSRHDLQVAGAGKQ
jgi:hypothetical protein